jgi:hypothetical protein
VACQRVQCRVGVAAGGNQAHTAPDSMFRTQVHEVQVNMLIQATCDPDLQLKPSRCIALIDETGVCNNMLTSPHQLLTCMLLLLQFTSTDTPAQWPNIFDVCQPGSAYAEAFVTAAQPLLGTL